MAVGDDARVVVAGETKVVYDEALEINRKVIAGQRVPPDLVEAYEASGGGQGDEAVDYQKASTEELTRLAEQRGLDVGDKPSKKDLVTAHEEFDGR